MFRQEHAGSLYKKSMNVNLVITFFSLNFLLVGIFKYDVLGEGTTTIMQQGKIVNAVFFQRREFIKRH
jgi:uncharacterized membrane protein YuzA (DUF378 family)